MSQITERDGTGFADARFHNKRILSGFIWVSLFVLVAKFAGAAKEMAVAWRYGVSEVVDGYVFVFNLTNWPVAVGFSVLTSVLVPLVPALRNQNRAELSVFRSEILAATILVGVVLGLLFALGMPIMLGYGWAGLRGHSLEYAQAMARPLSLILPLGLLNSLLAVWLMASGGHRNSLFDGLPALTILIVLLLPRPWLSMPLIWGTVIGFAVQTVALASSLHRTGETLKPRFGFRSYVWRNFLSGIGIVAIGQLLMSFTGVLDQFYASRLGEGAISSLSFANRIAALMFGLGALAISRATLPVFSEIHAAGHVKAVRKLGLNWALGMFALGLAVTVVMWIAAPLVVRLLFQRGSFSAGNVVTVSEVFRFLILQAPFYFSGLVLAAALSSLKKYRPLLMTGVIALVIKPAANAVFVPTMHIKGLALGMVAVYFCTASYMAFELFRHEETPQI